MSKASELFKKFRGRLPKARELATIKQDEPEESFEVGELYGIMYKVPGEKTPYLHRFTAGRRPTLFMSGDGRQIYVLNGSYKFTDRGFIG